jgi:uncharacterized membrane protein
MSFTEIAVISAIFAAIANILARVLLKNLNSKSILSINFAIMAITLALLSPFFYRFDLSPESLSLLIVVGAIDTLANYFYFKTFEKTEASIATPILSLAPGFTFLFSWLFIGDKVSLRTLILTIIIIFLIVLFSIDFKKFKHFKAAALIPALASSFLFGVSAVPSKYLLSNLHAINSPTLYMIRAGFIAIFGLLLFGLPPLRKITNRQYGFIFIRGLFVITQWLLLYYALTKGNAGVVVTLGNITPIFVFVFSVIFLRENPTIKKISAAMLVLILSLLI